jgi:hypothetical protein
VGRNTTLGDLNSDWELTHEMVHFGFPSVNRRHHWIEEGSATYVEPIARAMTGILTAEEVWGEMRRDTFQVLPEAGDQGLTHTHTWGRSYWAAPCSASRRMWKCTGAPGTAAGAGVVHRR